MCKTGCNACGGYWIKEPQSVTLTQIANACSRHEQQFTEQQQNKHENSKDNILKHVDVMGCQRFLRTPNNTTFLLWFLDVAAPLSWLAAYCKLCHNSQCQISTLDVRYSLDVMSKTKSPVVCVGGGSNMGLVVEDGEEEEEKLFFFVVFLLLLPRLTVRLEWGWGWLRVCFLFARRSITLLAAGGWVSAIAQVSPSI